MKTNHQRNFKADNHSFKGGQSWGRVSNEIGVPKSISASIGYSFANGNRGMAKAVAGAKKFVRSRVRAHENGQLKKIADGGFGHL